MVKGLVSMVIISIVTQHGKQLSQHGKGFRQHGNLVGTVKGFLSCNSRPLNSHCFTVRLIMVKCQGHCHAPSLTKVIKGAGTPLSTHF